MNYDKQTKLQLIDLMQLRNQQIEDLKNMLKEADDLIEKLRKVIEELKEGPKNGVALSSDQAATKIIDMIMAYQPANQNRIVSAIIKELTSQRKRLAKNTADTAKECQDNLNQFLTVADGRHYIDEVA
jgi:sugar-specific transcriptional regulator TrmB